MAEVIYLELSYKIIGLAFRVFNELGYGMNEKHYQKAFVKELEQEGINFEREKPVIINYKDKTIGKYFLDFVIDNKIIVELKIRPRIGYTHIKQVFSYLRTTGYKLAILIYFTREGVKYRRVLNSL
ncbi:GxxExxY protein [Candidatus Wolfebacteria bacterium CG03_land_8_20_14_0_80_36_15]|uniref:GxxExxY protein n=1 Tax=Candidatus Wolfebacteria bacterium CG03_land_8_20_14_0_80_36_15 TaxID=1975067 RepID=A0A2M7B8I5_9BACT|nr:MAG: GxxExxY protein [Candidatus Wolfebacteria bacterium CG03_land_8_20_14_0_80_36_15]